MAFITLTLFLASLRLAEADNSYPPVLTTKDKSIIVLESAKIGTTLATLTATDRDGINNLAFSVRDQATAAVVKLDTAIKTSANELSVNVLLNSKLDSDYHANSVLLIFGVTDGVYTSEVRLLMIIGDVNDETPVFLNLPRNVFVSEATAVDTKIYHVNATDPDVGIGGLVLFSIQLTDGEDNPFQIDRRTGVISLARELDFERRTSYTCVVTAKDGGGLRNTSRLLVTVGDVQDTPPVFERTSYTADVPENARVGQPIMTVRAQDGDLSDPNKVFMKLESGHCSDMFKIDPESGEITLNSTLDRESEMFGTTNGICLLNVTAIEDSGNKLQHGAFETSTTVIVVVTDVNDNHPTFNTGKMNATTGRHVTEGAPVVYRRPHMLTVYDNDKGPYGLIDIYLRTIGGQHDYMFRVTPTKAYSQTQVFLEVINATALSLYPFPVLTVEVYAKETASSNHVAMVTVTIDIIDAQSQCNFMPVIG